MKKLFYLICFFAVFSAFNFILADAASTLYIASPEGEIALYISPGEGEAIVEKVPSCAQISLIKTSGTWGLVMLEKKTGWINLSFTRASYEDAVNVTGFEVSKNVKVDSPDKKIDLYSLPAKHSKYKSEKKYTIPNGMVLEIKRETPTGWGLASLNGEYTWLQLDGVTDYKTPAQETASRYDIYTVYALSDGGTGISLYKNMKADTVLAIIPDCVELTVSETSGNFASVSYGGLKGWIDLRCTADSLFHAQEGAGEKINAEYQIIKNETEKSLPIFSVPSDNPDDGVVAGYVKGGQNVFVQRRTLDGWSLINYEGVVGWIAPGSCIQAEKTHLDTITVYDSEKAAYIATSSDKGARLYSMYDAKASYAVIPECVKVNVLAQKNGYKYVCCDYASGWIREEDVTDSYSDSLYKNKAEKVRVYTLKKDAVLQSIPTELPILSGERVGVIKSGTKIDVLRIVTTENEKWGLTITDKKAGWIKLTDAQTMLYDYEVLIINIVRAMFLILLIIIVMIVFFKKRKVRTNE